MTEHKSFIVTLKDSASDADLSGVKKKVTDIGGKVESEFSLIKGFVAKLPLIHASSIKEDSAVLNVEEDSEVKIQDK